MVRYALMRRGSEAGALVVLVTALSGLPAAAQPPRDQAREESRLVVYADVFADERWSEVVSEEEGRITSEGGPRLRITGHAAATLRPLERRSIDRDVLQGLIADRSRQLAMRAVADAIATATGPFGQRAWVADFALAVRALLQDRTGMQSTHVEALVSVLVRGLLAEAIVRMRFPEREGGVDSAVNACHWRETVFHEEPEARERAIEEWRARGGGLRENPSPEEARTADRMRACLRAPIRALAESCGGSAPGDRPIGCELRTSADGERAWAQWLPDRRRDTDAAAMRAYLTDLAYWALGRTPLFARRQPAPVCGLPRHHPHGRMLCAFVENAPNDGERGRRVEWLIGLDHIMSGLHVGQSLLQILRPPVHDKLRDLVLSLAGRTDLGSFATTWALQPDTWERLSRIEIWASAARGPLADLARALRSFERAPDPAGAAAYLRTTAGTLTARLDEKCAQDEGVLGTFCDDRPPDPGGAAGITGGVGAAAGGGAGGTGGCEPRTVRQWLADLSSGTRLDEAGTQPAGPARLRALCLPPRLLGAIDRLQASGTQRAQVDDLLARVGDSATRLATIVEETRAAALPDDVAQIDVAELDRLAGRLASTDEVLDTLDRDLSAPELRELLRYTGGGRMPVWRTEVTLVHRAVRGLHRLASLFSAIDVQSLRARAMEKLGEVLAALASLAGGPEGSAILDLLGAALPYLDTDRRVGIETMLMLLEQLPLEGVVVKLGIAPQPADWCEIDEACLACWVQRVVLVLREATEVHDDQVTVDPNRLVETIGALGDDFRRRREWRWYFHLTIGLGEMVSILPAEEGEARETRLVPFMAEQIGLGYASPTYCDDAIALRFGLFGSGVLYRIVVDNAESEALMFGAFAAADLYELLELYVAPMVLLYPPTEANAPPPSLAIAFGAQVPLSDYLSRL